MGSYHKTTLADRKEIVRRYNAGEARKSIAHDFKITEQMVGYYARAANAPMRRGGARPTGSYRIGRERLLEIFLARELARKTER
jgi:hypothetical protein